MLQQKLNELLFKSYTINYKGVNSIYTPLIPNIQEQRFAPEAAIAKYILKIKQLKMMYMIQYTAYGSSKSI